jgi:hypothetical protein
LGQKVLSKLSARAFFLKTFMVLNLLQRLPFLISPLSIPCVAPDFSLICHCFGESSFVKRSLLGKRRFGKPSLRKHR